MPDDLAFVVRGLTKTYATEAGEVHALRGVDLDIWRGETLVLLGSSGSGKSTLLNILGGLGQATSGSATFNALDLCQATQGELTRFRRASIGFIFQVFNLIPSLTARENVALITEIAADPLSPEKALAAVGLDHRTDHFPAQLSGREQQRVAVARFYADTAFADVFASAKRTPLSLATRLGRLDGVTAVDVRIVETGLMDVPGLTRPATARPCGAPAWGVTFTKCRRTVTGPSAPRVATAAGPSCAARGRGSSRSGS